ncbi:hypothetical protein [Pseudaestuariivita sp.]|uniref:hypothetical protein n=1 Tax=Pseudaestuariivita sp. TaxID=2211669 RepID=UPI004058C307
MLFLARHARWVLVAGLIAGVLLPGWAAVLTPWLQVMVAVLLALTAFRIGPGLLAGLRGAGLADLRAVLVLQLVLPLGLVMLAAPFGVVSHPLVLSLVLMLAAPSIMAAPALCQMMGGDGARAMRLLVLGSAVLPITVIAVLWALFGAGGFGDALSAALRLAALVLGAVALGFGFRKLSGNVSETRLRQVDGLNALVLAIFVIALMPAIAATWLASPGTLLLWLAAAFAANFGLQWLGYQLTGSLDLAVVAGNRNKSLFLAALSPETMAPVLVFLGCYQIPMFLTPLILPKLLPKARPDTSAPH